MSKSTTNTRHLDGADKEAASERFSKILESLGVEAVCDDLKERCLTILMEAEYIVTFLVHEDCVARSADSERRLDSKNCLVSALGGKK